MHIRIRNQVAQLIRTTYDPASKKGKNLTLGRVRLSKPELDDTLRKALTNEEIAQFDAWRKSQAQTAQLRCQLAALTLTDSMADAARWLTDNQDTEEAKSVAANIQREFPQLRKVLKKFALPE